MKTIYIGSDHAGFELKEFLKKEVNSKNYELSDSGAYSSESVDYTDFAHSVASSVLNGDSDLGILICGSGNGVAMAANKHKNIRAALCWTSELATLAVEHNNANILCLPARFISEKDSLDIVRAFLSANFQGGRHEKRVNKINCLENNLS